jgi:hypothetical protein
MRRALAVAVALALAATACSYDFDNPAEKLGMGQALGRAVVDPGSGMQPLAGTLVALENSPFFNQVTQSSGRFTLLSLPMGQHRVLFRKGTQWAASRVVEIVPGEDGKPEGVNLGDVRLRYTVTLQGSVSLPAGVQTFLFKNLVVDVTDEASGQPAALASLGSQLQYTFRGLAVGPHRIRFAVTGDYDPLFTGSTERRTYVASPLSLDVSEASEGQQLSLNPVQLEPETSTSVLGSVRLRLQAVGPNGRAAAASAHVELHDALTFDPTPGSTLSLVDTLAPDSAGFVQADEPPGLYVARVIPPPSTVGAFQASARTASVGRAAAPQPATWIEPDPVRVVVRSGTTSDGGTLYLVDSFTGGDAALACFSSADCQSGTCVDFQCQGGSPVVPPSVAPFNAPYCAQDDACTSTPGQPCGVDRKGMCLSDCTGLPTGAQPPLFCYPDGVSKVCTPDGVHASTGSFSIICP